MDIKNEMKLEFTANSENVGIARVTAAAFAVQLDFTLSTIEEIKVAISEAVSNSVIHGYGNGEGTVFMTFRLYADQIEITVTDHGRGIPDIEQARQPTFSSDPERMGLGFVFMESFMDEVEVWSEVHKGTTVRMVKGLQSDQVPQ
jgi:stage II sporulation protein AB (anti-sigma F factor)